MLPVRVKRSIFLQSDLSTQSVENIEVKVRIDKPFRCRLIQNESFCFSRTFEIVKLHVLANPATRQPPIGFRKIMQNLAEAFLVSEHVRVEKRPSLPKF